MSKRTQRPAAVVIGAGVAGLTSALMLARASWDVTIVAKWMPGDEAAEFTSPWAGANYLPVSAPGSKAHQWDKNTWPYLWKLAMEKPEAGVNVQKATLWHRKPDKPTDITDWFKELVVERPWFSDMVPEFRTVPPEELPEGFTSGTSFKTVCINVPTYMSYLECQVKEAGVVFRRASLEHVCDASKLHHSGRTADVVVCCPGILATRLKGIEDKKVFPARGQLVHVRNEIDGLYTAAGINYGPFETMYAQPRPGGGTILGGSFEKNNWSGEIDEELGRRIMDRAVKACPQLIQPPNPGTLDVVRHMVGLRPVREGGIRVEREDIQGVDVVHNYGHGGYGYQSSYGCALEVVILANEVVTRKSTSSSRDSKL